MASTLGKTLKEVDEMDADEVLSWQYYFSEPRGEKRADYHAAQICHAIYTILLSLSGSSDKKMKLEDNLLSFKEDGDVSQQEADQRTLRMIMGLQAMFGNKVDGFNGDIIKKAIAIEIDNKANGKTNEVDE